MASSFPSSLDLPPHLSAQKYFFVCTLTVAAWDTLVLSPRTWRLLKTPGWPVLKVLFHFLRVFMPLELVVVGEICLRIVEFSSSSPQPCFIPAVAFFDTKWSQSVTPYHIYSLILASCLLFSPRLARNSFFSNLFVPLSC